MATLYHDGDADMSVLAGTVIGVIGYGNQGRAQGLNLRDSGLNVVIGCPPGPYRDRAQSDGFEAVDAAAAAAGSDVVLMLIPDEVQPAVYEADVRPGLSEGNALVFASGYNVHFGLVEAAPGVDVLMVAPRMIGRAVRSAFTSGGGFPCFVAVHRDATGQGWPRALAVARGIGGTRTGAIASSFEEEVLIDLLAEQFLWAGIVRMCTVYYDLLVEAGCSPEAVATDLYLSGEMEEIARAMRETGFFKQLDLHSQTSQYGQLSRGERMVTPEVERAARQALEELRDGTFAREWAAEQAKGKPALAALKSAALDHPLNRVEAALRAALRRTEGTP